MRKRTSCCDVMLASTQRRNASTLEHYDKSFALAMANAPVPSGCCCEARATRAATSTLLTQLPSLLNYRGV
jgi:hypothetical protein